VRPSRFMNHQTITSAVGSINVALITDLSVRLDRVGSDFVDRAA
jgi:hypothetical protein